MRIKKLNSPILDYLYPLVPAFQNPTFRAEDMVILMIDNSTDKLLLNYIEESYFTTDEVYQSMYSTLHVSAYKFNHGNRYILNEMI
jgi:hypothetical protein